MEEQKLCINIDDQYLYTLNSGVGDIVLHFENSKLVFHSYLIFKVGYPNEDIYYSEDDFIGKDLTPSVLYQIKNSNWIDEIILRNQIHPQHREGMFNTEKHFKIFFEDETFECIAESYEIINRMENMVQSE